MSRGFRKSVTDMDLAYGDDYGAETPIRWDRQRFERARARSRGPQPLDTVVVEEDRYNPRRGERQDIRIEVDNGRRAPRRRYEEPDPEPEPRYSPPRRRRPEYVEEERFEIESREVAPYRPPPRRQARPTYQRRQSSLDTYDRRPIPRYGEEERDVNVSINVRPPPPPEPKYREPREPQREYRYRDPDPYRDDFRIRREREREIIRTPEKVEESSDSFEEIEVPAPAKKKRGKTRMPKRLIHKSALIQLGYAFDEEEDFYVVRAALPKEDIDEVIKLSAGYFEDGKVVYKFQDTKLLEAPPPPPSFEPPVEAPPVAIYETITTKIIENPTPADYAMNSEAKSVAAKSVRGGRSPSPAYERAPGPIVGLERTVVAEFKPGSPPRVRRGRSRASRAKSTREEESSSSSSDEAALVVVPSRRKSVRDRDIKAEIRALEAEKKALERKEKRENEFEIVEGREKASAVRVEKDKRGRLALVRPH